MHDLFVVPTIAATSALVASLVLWWLLIQSIFKPQGVAQSKTNKKAKKQSYDRENQSASEALADTGENRLQTESGVRISLADETLTPEQNTTAAIYQHDGNAEIEQSGSRVLESEQPANTEQKSSKPFTVKNTQQISANVATNKSHSAPSATQATATDKDRISSKDSAEKHPKPVSSNPGQQQQKQNRSACDLPQSKSESAKTRNLSTEHPTRAAGSTTSSKSKTTHQTTADTDDQEGPADRLAANAAQTPTSNDSEHAANENTTGSRSKSKTDRAVEAKLAKAGSQKQRVGKPDLNSTETNSTGKEKTREHPAQSKEQTKAPARTEQTETTDAAKPATEAPVSATLAVQNTETDKHTEQSKHDQYASIKSNGKTSKPTDKTAAVTGCTADTAKNHSTTDQSKPQPASFSAKQNQASHYKENTAAPKSIGTPDTKKQKPKYQTAAKTNSPSVRKEASLQIQHPGISGKTTSPLSSVSALQPGTTAKSEQSSAGGTTATENQSLHGTDTSNAAGNAAGVKPDSTSNSETTRSKAAPPHISPAKSDSFNPESNEKATGKADSNAPNTKQTAKQPENNVRHLVPVTTDPSAHSSNPQRKKSHQSTKSSIEMAIAKKNSHDATCDANTDRALAADSVTAKVNTTASTETQPPAAPQESRPSESLDAELRAQLAASELKVAALQKSLGSLQHNLADAELEKATTLKTSHNRPTLLSKVRVLDTARVSP